MYYFQNAGAQIGYYTCPISTNSLCGPTYFTKCPQAQQYCHSNSNCYPGEWAKYAPYAWYDWTSSCYIYTSASHDPRGQGCANKSLHTLATEGRAYHFNDYKPAKENIVAKIQLGNMVLWGGYPSHVKVKFTGKHLRVIKPPMVDDYKFMFIVNANYVFGFIPNPHMPHWATKTYKIENGDFFFAGIYGSERTDIFGIFWGNDYIKPMSKSGVLIKDPRFNKGHFVARSEPGYRNDYITFMLKRTESHEYKRFIVHDEWNALITTTLLKANDDYYNEDSESPEPYDQEGYISEKELEELKTSDEEISINFKIP